MRTEKAPQTTVAANRQGNERKTHEVQASAKKIRSIIVVCALCVLMLASVITFVSKLIEYNEIEAEKKLLEARIAEKQARIEELQYWLEAPMDEDYIMKFAREKLDYYRSDEIVFTNDQNN